MFAQQFKMMFVNFILQHQRSWLRPSILMLFTCLYYSDPTKYNGHRLDVKALQYRRADHTGQAVQCNSETTFICISFVGLLLSRGKRHVSHNYVPNKMRFYCDNNTEWFLDSIGRFFIFLVWIFPLNKGSPFSCTVAVDHSRITAVSQCLFFLFPHCFFCNGKRMAFQHLYRQWSFTWILKILRSGK